jgi:quercetin dioxygenase-like cupin family protein
MERTITNPLTGERCTFEETSRETGGVRSVALVETTPQGGVPMHRHGDHEETIEVLEGELEVTLGGVARRYGPGERVVIPAGAVHAWRNASRDRNLTMRGTMVPGHPGFERFLRVWYGLGRDGELKANGMPRRVDDLALLAEWDPSIFIGFKRVLAPVMRAIARRAHRRGRADELLRRYDPPVTAA